MDEIIGTSSYSEDLRIKIEFAAKGNFPVLILGESGTGKELIARSIHALSHRSSKELVTINCGAVSESLQEAEFFGHMRGAYTGAIETRQGFVSAANESTLFLDEIADISLNTQVKLLRVLDRGEYIPVGSTETKKADIRIVSATNKNLEDMVKNDLFREDFFYRLKGYIIRTLPISQHLDDIKDLIIYFMKDSGKQISDDALNVLKSHSWPGNARELKYTIEILCSIPGKTITSTDILTILSFNEHEERANEFYQDISTYKVEKKKAMDFFESRYFNRLLTITHGNISKSAKFAGMFRPNLAKKLKAIDIEIEKYRTS